MKNFFLAIVLGFITVLNGLGQNTDNTLRPKYKMQPVVLQTRWAKQVSPATAHKEYPRPQMERKSYINLNGLWSYAITLRQAQGDNRQDKWDGQILVPYPVESALSGVKKSLLPEQNLWYKRQFKKPLLKNGEHLLLHFGAVDWKATVYVNGNEVGTHAGGYTAFSFDITNYLKSGNNELVVKVYDPTDKGYQPHGKQVLNPGNIYYTPTSGIWQTVWMEVVPETYIKRLTIAPNIDKEFVHVLSDIENETGSIQTEATVWFNGKLIAKERRSSNSVDLDIPNAKLWSPDIPNLYTLRVRLFKNSKLVDEVSSYFGMRKIEIKKDDEGFDRIFLNNKYTYNLGVLDQGFWPDGLYTAPTDEALAFDIKAIKAMGFNTIRKHIKVEPARWYYYADKLGMMVWQDFVNPNQGLPAGAKEEFEKESQEIMDQLHNHPSITTWVLFNERWGAYDQKRLTEWVKSYDPTRLVNGHTGELLYVNDKLRAPSKDPYVSSDMTDVHSYPDPMLPVKQEGKAMVVGEFGGVGVPVPYHEWNDLQGWGYVQVTANELKGKYAIFIKRLKKLEAEGLSGSIYTQPFDVEGEENGLLTYDRDIIKMPLTEIRKMNSILVKQTKGFAIDPKFLLAKNIEADDNDSRYAEFLSDYDKGKRDSAFLRRLNLMALRKKDQLRASQISGSYIGSLKLPYSPENLIFIRRITRSSKDKGFAMFLKDSAKVNAVVGANTAQGFVKKIIGAEEIDPYLKDKNVKPDWNTIQQRIVNKYGELGQEYVDGRQMVYYWSSQPVNGDSLGKYYKLYFEKALTHSEWNINNMSWRVFEHVKDPKVLKLACDVMRYDIEHFDSTDPFAYDTYANLLYKAGNKKEAIEWEQKALNMSDNKKNYQEVIDKMKRGEKTWTTKK